MKYLRRLIWRQEGEFFNPLMHAFLFQTLAFSLAFLFFDWSSSVQESTLYKASLHNFGSEVGNVWGLVGLTVVILNTIMILLRPKRGFLGWTVFAGGMYLWSYAGAVYWLDGYHFQFIVAALPQMFFWLWYGYRMVKYRRDEVVSL